MSDRRRRAAPFRQSALACDRKGRRRGSMAAYAWRKEPTHSGHETSGAGARGHFLRGNHMNKLAIAVAFLSTSLASAAAELYPARPITVVVPYPAGGPTDTLARILADHMRTSLGQSVIIENVTGGGGSIGVGRGARAAADGYTVSIGHWNTHVVHGATLNLSFHVLNDFEPVALL